MSTSVSESGDEILWRLTPDQRMRVYEQEKERLEKSGPMLSTRTKVLVAIYIVGCVLLYFGIPQSLLEFCGTGHWIHKPETTIFHALGNAAIELVRPFLACWFLAIPGVFIFGMYAWAENLLGRGKCSGDGEPHR